MAASTVDQSALKVNQAGIILTLLVAFFLSAAWTGAVILVPLLAIVMLAGSIEPRVALFRQVYLRVLRPAGLVRARVIVDSPKPHAFAQQVGGVFLLLATIAFLAGSPIVGWGLSWIVIVLAFVNFAFNYCVGCRIFYRLERAGLVKA